MPIVLPKAVWRRLSGLKHCGKGKTEVGGTFILNLSGKVLYGSVVFTFQLQLFSCKELF